MNRRDSIFLNIDWVVVVIYLFLVFFGLLNIYSSLWTDSSTGIFEEGSNSRKQSVFIALSIGVSFIILLLDGNIFQRMSYAVYVITILGLLAVLVVGEEISGARSWINMGGFNLQPAEFAKVGTALAVARYISKYGYYDLPFKKKAPLFLLILLPIILIILEPDAGSAIVFLSFIFPLFREGFSMGITILLIYLIIISVLSLVINSFLLLGIIVVLAIVGYFVFRRYRGIVAYLVSIIAISAVCVFSVKYAFDNFLMPHQQTRIQILLGEKDDIKGAGYNINQSKIAIGSGALFGKGFLKGTETKLNFVPEQHTDFIFCTVGEEYGFVGCLIVLSIFLTLLIKLVFMAERQRTRFSRVYGYCVVGILFFHIAINICMTIGLMPVIGIPLPFFSYGGSSMLSFSILLFIFIKLDSYRYSILQ